MSSPLLHEDEPICLSIQTEFNRPLPSVGKIQTDCEPFDCQTTFQWVFNPQTAYSINHRSGKEPDIQSLNSYLHPFEQHTLQRPFLK